MHVGARAPETGSRGRSLRSGTQYCGSINLNKVNFCRGPSEYGNFVFRRLGRAGWAARRSRTEYRLSIYFIPPCLASLSLSFSPPIYLSRQACTLTRDIPLPSRASPPEGSDARGRTQPPNGNGLFLQGTKFNIFFFSEENRLEKSVLKECV